jgi:TetR/AcrR family tetracycline transcriptional repressor
MRKKTDPSAGKTKERFIRAALELLSEEGIDELSLRKLASRLGMKASAVYWHFKDKETLIDCLAEDMLKQEFPDMPKRAARQSWQEWHLEMCHRLRKAMLRYPDGARIITGAHSPTLLDFFEASLASLVSAGLDIREAKIISLSAVHFVFGNTIEEQTSPSPAEVKNAEIKRLHSERPHIAQTLQLAIKSKNRNYWEFDSALRRIIGMQDKGRR